MRQKTMKAITGGGKGRITRAEWVGPVGFVSAVVLPRYTSRRFHIILYKYFNSVSCEFDKFRVDAHLCKLRNPPVGRPFVVKLPEVKFVRDGGRRVIPPAKTSYTRRKNGSP